MTTPRSPHPILNRDREEIRIPSPYSDDLLAFLKRKGFRGSIRTDIAGDVIALDGEPDMGRVAATLHDWEEKGNPNQG